MAEFILPVDIANRACQHVGVPRLDRTQGFLEDSQQASQIGDVYGKLRRAELRRNVWRFAIRRSVLRAIDTTTMRLAAALWQEDATYFVGSIVLDGSNNVWISRSPDNLGNNPASSPTLWEPFFGSPMVTLYSDTTSYFTGELVYTTPGDGTNKVYLSLQNNNEDDPETATDWDDEATYYKNQVVTYSAVTYMSLIDFNINQTPSSSPQLWDSGTSYSIGNSVGASDGYIYTSVINANLGNDPIDGDVTKWTNTNVLNPWTREFTGGTGSVKWLQVGGDGAPAGGVTLATPNIIYPVGCGPSSQDNTRNIYPLPCNFLREAPQDPKAGSHSWIGAPTGLDYNDWNPERDFIISSEQGPIVLRFVADITDVSMMDDMFCEGLGLRIALEVCEPLTQSNAKLNNIAQKYQKFFGEARTVNAIETGSTEPPTDDYLACRA